MKDRISKETEKQRSEKTEKLSSNKSEGLGETKTELSINRERKKERAKEGGGS